MSAVNQQIRELAQRVAASHGLEMVDMELQGGGGRHRVLRVFLERNAEGRAALEQRLRDLNAEPQTDGGSAGEGAIELDLVAAGEAAGLEEDEDELAWLRSVPEGVPVAQLSGITHGDCERFAQDFGTALDVEDLIAGAEYVLEVSSPGLDRKLGRKEDFERFAGQMCKLQTFTAVAGNRHWQGRLGEVRGDALLLLPQAEKKTGKGKKAKPAAAEPAPIEIAIANIEKAQLVPEF